jgi:hypothetical protein
MNRGMTRVVLGLSIIASSLAVTATASAQNWMRWQNRASTYPYGSSAVYLSLKGGPLQTQGVFYIKEGTPVIIWGGQTVDQSWSAQENATGLVQNLLTDSAGRNMFLGVAGGSTTQGASLIIWRHDGNPPNQTWTTYSAESLGLGAVAGGCFVFVNSDGLVMGVQNANMTPGTQVIQWPFLWGATGHMDQFWCPTN